MHKKMNNNKNIRCSVVNFIFLFNFDILDFRFEEKNNNKNNFKFLKHNILKHNNNRLIVSLENNINTKIFILYLLYLYLI